MSLDLPPEWPEEWAPPKVSIKDMVSALTIERKGIIRRQKDLIAAGDLRGPDEGMLKRALAFHRAESFILKCAPYIDRIQNLIADLQRRGPRG